MWSYCSIDIRDVPIIKMSILKSFLRESQRKHMPSSKYLMSFTTGGLFYQESVNLTNLYLDKRNWQEVKETALFDNLLQARTKSTAQRILRETTLRLTLLTDSQLQLLADGTRSEQNYILWLAVCKRYTFIQEFAIEVLREKFLCLEIMLTYDDYDFFYNKKAQWHDELENLSPTTRTKNRSVLFRILLEAELLASENLINPALFTKELVSVIAADNASLFACYPISDRDIKELI